MNGAPAWVNETVQCCPECGQTAKVYRRLLTADTASALIAMYRGVPDADGFHHMPTLLNRKQADEAKARYWGLIRAKEEIRTDGSNRNGYWKLTFKGRQFVRNRIQVPKYALVYNKECLLLEGDPVSIEDALGEKFNYRELMGR